MMLSVLIVNYNVRYFLEHCLLSVQSASEYLGKIKGWNCEVLVIDNASSDESLVYLRPLFPDVRFLEAGENLGFARANNRLVDIATGSYVLFLNPDSLVPEDCFVQTLDFMEKTLEAGACGVRMIDGSGQYLPESKRGFPGGWNSFMKMSGLIRLFPRSKTFAGYYEGHLSDRQTHEVAVLSGAWMMVRRSVLKQTGGFDERFFMYAEDIDLSYRICLAGFRNFYFAGTTIIHFKGESTSKDKEYTTRFYTAMIQFVDKHFSGVSASMYKILLKGFIKLRSFSSPSNNKTSADNRENSSVPGGKKIILGDDASAALLKSILAKKRTEANTGADEIVYCIGESFSVSDLVKAMEDETKLPKRIFHPRAAAIIGSDSKNKQGLTEILIV